VIAQKRLGPGRIHHCMRWIGQCHRAMDMLCERALSRYTSGSLLADKQTVQNWIADSWAEIQAFRLMTLHAAWVIDDQGSSAARTEIAAIKFFGAKVLHDVIDRAVQVHGSLGYSTDMPLEQMYRLARSARRGHPWRLQTQRMGRSRERRGDGPRSRRADGQAGRRVAPRSMELRVDAELLECTGRSLQGRPQQRPKVRGLVGSRDEAR